MSKMLVLFGIAEQLLAIVFSSFESHSFRSRVGGFRHCSFRLYVRQKKGINPSRHHMGLA